MNPRTIDFRHQPTVQQACLGFADDPFKTIVREDGSLNYHYAGRNDFSEERLKYYESVSPWHRPTNGNHEFLHRLKPRFTHRDMLVSRTQDHGDPRVALVRTLEQFENSSLEWECFAYQDQKAGVRADVVLWTLAAQPGFGHAASRVELELHGERKSAPLVISWSEGSTHNSVEGLRLVGTNQNAFLTEGQTRKGLFVILQKGELRPEVVDLAWGLFAREQCRQYWTNLRPLRHAFQIPDASIQDMVEACARNILQAREVHDDNKVFQVGPTIYRGLWTVDGHFLLQAAHLMGRQQEAFEQGLTAILRRIQPNGSVELIPGHLKETGIAIATIVRQCELMGRDDRLRELWPTILRGVDYLDGLRGQARELGPEYPARDLFPPAIIDGGIEGPFPDYTTPAWILVGLKEARDAGRRLGLPRTDAISLFYDQVREAFLRYADRDRKVTPEGIPYLPMIMVPNDYNRPQSATWALAQAMYPGEVFPPEHELVRDLLHLLDSIDDEQGLPIETGWIHDQAIWSYSAMFYAQVWLYAGRGDKAVDYLYAFANHASPARVWREEHTLTSSHSSEYCGDMPHNWGSAEFIRLVRNLLILEKAGGLELLAGLPPEWLPREGMDLVLEDSPTRYGLVSLRLSAVGDAFRLTYRRQPGVIEPSFVTLNWQGAPFAGGVLVASRETTLDLPRRSTR